MTLLIVVTFECLLASLKRREDLPELLSTRLLHRLVGSRCARRCVLWLQSHLVGRQVCALARRLLGDADGWLLFHLKFIVFLHFTADRVLIHLELLEVLLDIFIT